MTKDLLQTGCGHACDKCGSLDNVQELDMEEEEGQLVTYCLCQDCRGKNREVPKYIG